METFDKEYDAGKSSRVQIKGQMQADFASPNVENHARQRAHTFHTLWRFDGLARK
jgi:hypothetical protein